MKLLIVGLGGFAGSVARYTLGGWVQNRLGPAFPYGTLVINVSGCFAIGLITTLALRLGWSDPWRLLIAIGFLGAFTTFSTFEYETLQLVADGARYQAALLNVFVSVIAGFAAAWAGIVVARLLMHGRI